MDPKQPAPTGRPSHIRRETFAAALVGAGLGVMALRGGGARGVPFERPRASGA